MPAPKAATAGAPAVLDKVEELAAMETLAGLVTATATAVLEAGAAALEDLGEAVATLIAAVMGLVGLVTVILALAVVWEAIVKVVTGTGKLH